MGTAPSRPAPEFTEKRREQMALVGRARDLADALASLDMNGLPTSESGSLDSANLTEWETAAAKVCPVMLSGPIIVETTDSVMD